MKSPSTATVGDYRRTLQRNWVVLIVSVVGAAVVGWLAHTLQPSHYESTATVLVSVTGPATVTADYANDLGGRLHAETYRNLVTSDQLLTRVLLADKAKALGESVTIADLRADVLAVNPTDSAIVRLTCRGDTASKAAALSNLVAVQLKGLVDELEYTTDGSPQTRIAIVDGATQPAEVPETAALTAIGLGAGVGLAIAVVALLGRDIVLNRVADGDDALHALRDWRGGRG